MCVSRTNCVCWANLFFTVQELLFRRLYGVLCLYGVLSLTSCPRGTSGHCKNEGLFKDKGLMAKD